jgi:hypothetical protein
MEKTLKVSGLVWVREPITELLQMLYDDFYLVLCLLGLLIVGRENGWC